MSSELNPYAAPAATLGDSAFAPTLGGEAEQVRRFYLKHEASVRSIGILYYLGGGIMALGAIGRLIATLLAPASITPLSIAITVVYLALVSGFIAVGRGLRMLRAWARVPVGIFSGIRLFGFPLGTLINGYILYLVFCAKGAMVFSQQYAEVIRQTPHIKYRTSLGLCILLAVLIAILLVAVISFLALPALVP